MPVKKEKTEKPVAEPKEDKKVEPKAEPKVEPKAEPKTEHKAAQKPAGRYVEAVGRRKTAIARVRLYDDHKKHFTVNGFDYKEYLKTADLIRIVESPLKATGHAEMSASVKVAGSGTHSQAEAIRHGITRALLVLDKDLRATLKPLDYITRDPRQKERKKPGLKRARRAPQWAKR